MSPPNAAPPEASVVQDFPVPRTGTATDGERDEPGLWWKAPLELTIHVLVGAAIFSQVAGAAVGLELLVRYLRTMGISSFVLMGLQIAEYLLFGVDFLLFVIFVAKTTWRAIPRL